MCSGNLGLVKCKLSRCLNNKVILLGGQHFPKLYTPIANILPPESYFYMRQNIGYF